MKGSNIFLGKPYAAAAAAAAVAASCLVAFETGKFEMSILMFQPL